MAKPPGEEITSKIKNMNINAHTKKDINFLLIGESGVGKSTFINSIFNYLQYGDFEKAESETQVTVLIPAKFDAYDKDGKSKTVTVGCENDKNEYLSVGEAATQDVKTYIFKVRDTQTTIRLIDTPGMGDPQGLQKDDAHLENILSYISGLHHLHAICILLKPKTTRLTAFFSYCMNQILSRLEKSASKNLVFIFTNTRGDNYSPGDTLGILQRVVKEIKEKPPHVDIPLNQNVFCLDNEAFRYLAASKNGVEFGKNIRKKNRESWNKSTEECWKLISYVCNLQPHFVKHTAAINEARRMIFHLAQPIADIAENINDHLYILERHKAHLSMDYDDLADLKKHLYMPIVSLNVITLSQPVTVCKDTLCGKVYKVGGVNKWNYKKPACHDPCYLKQVPKEIIGSPELANCQSINPSTQMCIKCGHHFSMHMHVYYISKTVKDKQIDDKVLTSINTKALAVDNAKKIIRNIEMKKKELEDELKIIVKCNAQFARFLQDNAIMPFSDSYPEYINHLIIREKSLGEASNPEIIKKLEDLVIQHKNVKDSLAMGSKDGDAEDNNVVVTPQNIQKNVEELYKLKNIGSKIKELYTSQKQSRNKEHGKTEYVHKTAFTKSAPQDKKNEKKENKNQKVIPENEGKKAVNVPPHPKKKIQSQPPKARTPPPAYDTAVGDPPGKNQRPPNHPDDYNRRAAPETYCSNYAFHPPPHSSYVPPPPPPDPRDARPYSYDYHDRSRYGAAPRPGIVDTKPKSDQPTSIQVNLTLPSRESTSASASVSSPSDDPYYRRDPHYPAPPPHHADPHYNIPHDPYYRYDDPYYRSRDTYYHPHSSPPPPRDDPYYRDRDHYYPPHDPHYPRDPHYPPRDIRGPPLRDPRGPPPRDPRDLPPRDPYYNYPPASSGGPPPPPPNNPPNAHPRAGYGNRNDRRDNRAQNHQQGDNSGGKYVQKGENRGRGNANRGRGGITRKNYKKKNPNANKNNDGDDSDTSVASSKK